jgi:hypothetical protein
MTKEPAQYKVVLVDGDRQGSVKAKSLAEAETLFAKMVEIAPECPIALVKGKWVLKHHNPDSRN